VFVDWKAGRPIPVPAYQDWFDLVRANVARGMEFRRLRIASEPLSEFLRFEYHITAGLNVAAGERVRWLPRRRATRVCLPGNDFWPTSTPPTNTDLNPTTPTLWAPPGGYTLTTTGDPLVNPTQMNITVTSTDEPETITINQALRPELTDRVNQQIRTRIDECASQASGHPTIDTSPLLSCPFSYDSVYTITDNPHWTINAYPVVALRLQDDGTITVTTTTPGQVTFTYRWTLDILPPQTWITANTTTPVTVTGHVVLDQETPTWTP
jgi:hypothetical protein